MIIDFTTLNSAQRYHAMVQSIIPRPIAWVLTANGLTQNTAAGSHNLAPYSFFTGVCSSPPLIMLSMGKKTQGANQGCKKDTPTNIVNNKKFVVHIASTRSLDALNASAATLDYGDSEVERGGLSLVPFEGFVLPRLEQCDLAMGCSLYKTDEIGDEPQTIIYGQIEQLYINDSITRNDDQRLHIDGTRLDPLARLGGNNYGQLGATLTAKRPK